METKDRPRNFQGFRLMLIASLVIWAAAFGLSGCATTVLTWLARKANTTEAGAPEWKKASAEMERILEEPEP